MKDKVPEYRGTMPRFGRGGAGNRFKPGEKPVAIRKTLCRLFSFFSGRYAPLFTAIFLTILSTVVSLLTPWLTGKGINAFLIGTQTINASLLGTVLLSLVVCYFVTWVTDTVSGTIMTRLAQNLVKYIRTQLYSKLQRLPLNFYDTHQNGDIMSRITNDADTVSSTLSQTVTQFVSSIISVAGAAVMMLLLSRILTLAALISIPLFMLLTNLISRKSRPFFQGQQRSLGFLSSVVEENIDGLAMIRAFNLQNEVFSRFSVENTDLKNYSIRAQVWAGFMMPFVNVISNLGYAFISCIGGILVVKGAVTVGVVVSFLSYARQFGRPLNSIAGMFTTIQSALAGVERIFNVIDEEEERPDVLSAVAVGSCTGKVEFKDVFFSYVPGKTVLHDISFTVPAGKTVALVGETGSGKTTIVQLLTRFYEKNSGCIFIDDIDISEMKRNDLRRLFSVVLQDTCLFTGTIADNIRYSRPEASEDEVIRASKLACADSFISRLPRKYETMVSGSADNLSAGQRQLLAIARAILCQAPILILDEATSSVDTRTEKEIQKAMLVLMKGHTSFLIAHRLSTIRDADSILVIGNGRILESGTHSELMNLHGPYYEMVMNQTGLRAQA